MTAIRTQLALAYLHSDDVVNGERWLSVIVNEDPGNAGSGPAQLSLALLADALGDDERAQDAYQDFKFKVVGRLPPDRWELSQEDIRQAVAQQEARRGRRPGGV